MSPEPAICSCNVSNFVAPISISGQNAKEKTAPSHGDTGQKKAFALASAAAQKVLGRFHDFFESKWEKPGGKGYLYR